MNKKKNKIIGVQAVHLYIYLGCLLFGIVLIGNSFILYNYCPSFLFDEILLSIGCSTIPTVIVAYLIDFASEKRESKKIEKLRSHFLWGMPHGILWIMKTVIERYYSIRESDNLSFVDVFSKSIEFMKNTSYSYDDLTSEGNDIKSLFKSMDYGISLCLRDCKSIINHDYELQIDSIFSKDELLAISYLYEECQAIMKCFKICEIAECIELFVENTIGYIEEVKIMVNRKVIIKNGLVKNWTDISKTL